MQASVHRYDPHTGAILVTDDGRTSAVAVEALTAAGLLTLRVGQRLAVEYDAAGQVTDVRIPGMPPRVDPAPGLS